VRVVSPIPFFPSGWGWGRWRNLSEIPKNEIIGGLQVLHPRYFLLPKVSMPFHGLLMFLGCLRCVTKLNQNWKIDCIDAHFVYPDGMAAVLLGKVLKVPVTVSARGTDMNVYPSFRLIRPMIRWTLRCADQLVAVSSSLKEAMLKVGTREEKIRVIPNGVDTERFQPLPADIAKSRLSISPSGQTIVSVGALIPSKGHRLLMQAFSKILARHQGLQLYIIGEGGERSSLEVLAKELGIDHVVHLVGKRPYEELPGWFSAGTVSCLLSSREGWPNVVTESLACGTPVVATNVGGIPEILCSADLGIIVEQTIDSAVVGLEQGLTKSWNRDAISRQGRARSWDKVAAEVDDLLRSSLSS
jgi:teichuronic acid biosynthesis glycosyltransferase TuaC